GTEGPSQLPRTTVARQGAGLRTARPACRAPDPAGQQDYGQQVAGARTGPPVRPVGVRGGRLTLRPHHEGATDMVLSLLLRTLIINASHAERHGDERHIL